MNIVYVEITYNKVNFKAILTVFKLSLNKNKVIHMCNKQLFRLLSLCFCPFVTVENENI